MLSQDNLVHLFHGLSLFTKHWIRLWIREISPKVWTVFGYKKKKKDASDCCRGNSVRVNFSSWVNIEPLSRKVSGWTLSHYVLSFRQWSFKVSDITRKIYNCNINCIRCSQCEPRGLAKFCFRQLLCVSLITPLLLLPSPRSFKETQFSSLCQLASNWSLLQVCYLKLQRDPAAKRAVASLSCRPGAGAPAGLWPLQVTRRAPLITPTR